MFRVLMAEDVAEESHGRIRVGRDADQVTVEESPARREPPEREDSSIDTDDGADRCS